MAKKFYAVRVGKTPGIYLTWDECKENVHGYPAAEYKSFLTMEEAKAFIGGTKASFEGSKTNSTGVEVIKASARDESELFDKIEGVSLSDDYAFVDGSYNITTGVYGFGGFLIHNKEKYVLSGSGSDKEMAAMRNVAGEILGSRAAIEKAIELGLKKVYIYFDYQGIKMWATGEWKRNKQGTKEYYEYIRSVKDIIDIEFIKVKGHSGVEGNEEADRLAKEAVGII